MRALLFVALAGATACGGASTAFMPMPLGNFAAAPPPASSATVSATATATAAVRELVLPPHESEIWDVRMAGMTIGRAELDIGDDEVHSTFTTSSVASMFATIHHELVTSSDRARAAPRSATETVVIKGEASHSDVAFDGNHYSLDHDGKDIEGPAGNAAHTIHSAIGWLRAWVDPNAQATTLYVVEDRALYRLELARPVAEKLRDVESLRVDGLLHFDAHDHDPPVHVIVWLAPMSRTGRRGSRSMPDNSISSRSSCREAS